MPVLELKSVSKSFGSGAGRLEVLRSVDLALEEGEFVAIVGFSGSGKSTLVNLLTGLQTPDRGQVIFKGTVNPQPGPDRGIVFQNYSLLPSLTVYENVKLGVDQVFRADSPEAKHERVLRYLRMVGLEPALLKRPHELSGGMRQRVSLARTLAMNPDVLILDEPLGALDALTRAVLQDEIGRIWAADKKTVLLVTNDVDEALLLADRIIPLKPGPSATLGEAFQVHLERPRDRASLNHCKEFKKLRNDIVVYLNRVRQESRELLQKSGPKRECPKLVPLDLRIS